MTNKSIASYNRTRFIIGENMKAMAFVKGSKQYPNIYGMVYFQQFKEGVEVLAKVHNLPPFSRDSTIISPFGFHLHDGNSCEIGTTEEPFPLSGGHYNPKNHPHGNHSGDFPVLMPLSNGTAILKFVTDKFTIADILGKTIVVHQSPDDFRTEPSGNSGKKIACGIIRPS